MAAATVAAPFSQQGRSGRTIGIQVGAVSFLDEGVDPILDRFQHDANVNALFIATFTYGRGIAGRQIPGQPLPDHGRQEYDTSFHGGELSVTHEQNFTHTSLTTNETPRHPRLHVLAQRLPP